MNIPLCPICTGDSKILGKLGTTEWYRCECCYFQFSLAPKEETKKTTKRKIKVLQFYLWDSVRTVYVTPESNLVSVCIKGEMKDFFSGHHDYFGDEVCAKLKEIIEEITDYNYEEMVKLWNSLCFFEIFCREADLLE